MESVASMNYSLTLKLLVLKLHSLKDVVIKCERDRKESMHHDIVACELEIKNIYMQRKQVVHFLSHIQNRLSSLEATRLHCLQMEEEKWRFKSHDICIPRR